MPRFVRLECSERAHLPMVVKMGKCRVGYCPRFDEWGPVGSYCPSTHQYNTRSAHKFQKDLCDDEKSLSNETDFQDFIGVCPITTCLEIGSPGMTCHRCLRVNFDSTLVKPEERFYLDFFVAYYYPACKKRNFSALRKIVFIHNEAVVDDGDSGDDDSLHNHSNCNVVSPARSVTGNVRRSAD